MSNDVDVLHSKRIDTLPLPLYKTNQRFLSAMRGQSNNQELLEVLKKHSEYHAV